MTGGIGWPRFTGRLRLDAESMDLAGDDFGHVVRRPPVAVVDVATEEDVSRLLRYAAQAGLRVAPRGQGHSVWGQAQAGGGIVAALGALDRIHALEPGRATVGAGTRWIDVAQAALKQGFLPPVLTDYLGLSVGGTLSVGGLSGTSFRCGAQVDNVERLVVATGSGAIVTCTAQHEADLFHAVLAGLGQCAVILRATIRLVEASPVVRVFRFTYSDPPSMLIDLGLLAQEDWLGYLLGIVTPAEGGGWDARIEATTSDPGPHDARLRCLADLVSSRRFDDRAQEDWVRRVDERVAELQRLGLWSQPHPWLDLLVPSSAIDQVLREVLRSSWPRPGWGS